MKTLEIKIANEITPFTVSTAIERLVRKSGLNYNIGHGGDLTGWKDEDLNVMNDDLVFVLRLRKND